jgi:hypothetical protein
MKAQVSPAVMVIIIVVVVAIVALVGWKVVGGKAKPVMKDGKGPGPGEFMKPGSETGGGLGPGRKDGAPQMMPPGTPTK